MEDMIDYPLTFGVRPGKTMLGLDRNSAFTFQVPKRFATKLISDHGMGESIRTIPISVSISGDDYPAELSWRVQDGSKPWKRGIERGWSMGREVLFIQYGSERFEETQLAVRRIMSESVNRIGRGQSAAEEELLVIIDRELRVKFEAW